MADVEIDFFRVQKRRKRGRFYLRLVIVCGVIYLASLGGAWIIFWSPLFRLEEIVVEGNRRIMDEEAINLLYSQFSSHQSLRRLFHIRNIIGWPPQVDSRALRLLPAIKNLTFQKDYGRRLIVARVEEREYYGIWCLRSKESPADCFWFDEEGMAFEAALATEGNLLRVVNDYSGKGLGFGSKILPDPLIPNLLSIFRVLEASTLNLEEVKLKDLKLQEVEAQIVGGPILYFSLRFPAESALPVIQKIFSEEDKKKLRYLDFRVENRVYYK